MDLDSIDAVDAHYLTHFGGEPHYMRFVDTPGTIGVLEWPKGTSSLPAPLSSGRRRRTGFISDRPDVQGNLSP